MGKDCEGRVAGHHITPGRGWRWQTFGGKMMLVTDGGGADVVLSLPAPGVMTCAPSGMLVPFKPDSPLGWVLPIVPDLVTIARDMLALNDRPRQLPILRDVLERGGLI